MGSIGKVEKRGVGQVNKVLDFEIEKEFVEIIKYREAFNDNAAR